MKTATCDMETMDGYHLSSKKMIDLRGNWNLNNDVDLLQRLEKFSQGFQAVIDRATVTLQCMENLEEAVNETVLRVSTVANSFQAIADKQFVENRVAEDEDPFGAQPVENSSMEWVSEDMKMSLEQSIKDCTVALGKKFETIQLNYADSEDELPFTSQIAVVPKNVYKDRRLPHLIGGQQFISDDTLGLPVLNKDDEDENGSGSDDADNGNSISLTNSHQENGDLAFRPTPPTPRSETGLDPALKSSLNTEKERSPHWSQKLLEDTTSVHSGFDYSDCDRPPPPNLNDESEHAKKISPTPSLEDVRPVSAFKDELAEVLKIKRAVRPTTLPTISTSSSSSKEDEIFAPEDPNYDLFSSNRTQNNFFESDDVDSALFSSRNVNNVFSSARSDDIFGVGSNQSWSPGKSDDIFNTIPGFNSSKRRNSEESDDRMEVDDGQNERTSTERSSGSLPSFHTASSDDASLYVPRPTKILKNLVEGRARIPSKRKLPSKRQKSDSRKTVQKATSIKSPYSPSTPASPAAPPSILSPATDEEDLFVLPSLDMPEDSNKLLFGPGLLSPGMSIDFSQSHSSQQPHKSPLSSGPEPDVPTKDPLFAPSKRQKDETWDPFSADDDDDDLFKPIPPPVKIEPGPSEKAEPTSNDLFSPSRGNSILFSLSDDEDPSNDLFSTNFTGLSLAKKTTEEKSLFLGYDVDDDDDELFSSKSTKSSLPQKPPKIRDEPDLPRTSESRTILKDPLLFDDDADG